MSNFRESKKNEFINMYSNPKQSQFNLQFFFQELRVSS